MLVNLPEWLCVIPDQYGKCAREQEWSQKTTIPINHNHQPTLASERRTCSGFALCNIGTIVVGVSRYIRCLIRAFGGDPREIGYMETQCNLVIAINAMHPPKPHIALANTGHCTLIIVMFDVTSHVRGGVMIVRCGFWPPHSSVCMLCVSGIMRPNRERRRAWPRIRVLCVLHRTKPKWLTRQNQPSGHSHSVWMAHTHTPDIVAAQ